MNHGYKAFVNNNNKCEPNRNRKCIQWVGFSHFRRDMIVYVANVTDNHKVVFVCNSSKSPLVVADRL